MSANPPSLSRRAALLMALGLGIGLSPVGFPRVTADGVLRFDPAAAWAKDGEDDDDDDEDERDDDREDREDEREDREDEQEDERDDDEEDSSGRGNDDDQEDEDNSGKDDGSDDNGDDGDSSGPGGGDDNSGGPGRNDGNTPRSDNGDDGDGPSSGSARVRDILVRYPDGWIERIVNGQYELIDNLNRQVIRRSATPDDFNRMYALR